LKEAGGRRQKAEGRRVVREMGIGTPMVPELVEGLKTGDAYAFLF
jgi:hypothetical protein